MSNRRLWIAIVLSAALQVTTSPAMAQEKPAYIGSWFTANAAECKRPRRHPEGALTYTATELFGAESTCKIVRAAKRGSATELSLLCRAEGETTKDSETVEVVQGKLRRTVKVEGKLMTFTYSRCP
jgi:hypothetical protein